MLNSVQLSPTYFLEPVKFHNDTRNSIYRKARLAIFNYFSYWPYFFVWLVLSLFNRACKINCRKIPRVFRDTRVSHIVSQIALFTNNTNSSVCIPTCSFSLQNLYIVQRQVLRLKKIINYIRFFSSLTAKFSNSSPLHSPPEEFENVGFTVKTQQIFSFHITSEEFKNTTIYRSCWIRLYLMKTSMVIVPALSKSSDFKKFSVHTGTKTRRFQIPAIWRAFSKSSVNRFHGVTD